MQHGSGVELIDQEGMGQAVYGQSKDDNANANSMDFHR